MSAYVCVRVHKYRNFRIHTFIIYNTHARVRAHVLTGVSLFQSTASGGCGRHGNAARSRAAQACVREPGRATTPPPGTGARRVRAGRGRRSRVLRDTVQVRPCHIKCCPAGPHVSVIVAVHLSCVTRQRQLTRVTYYTCQQWSGCQNTVMTTE